MSIKKLVNLLKDPKGDHIARAKTITKNNHTGHIKVDKFKVVT